MRVFLLALFCGALLSCSSTTPTIKLTENNPVIYLERSACFGLCPAYTLTLRGNGIANYDGLSNVEKVGKHSAQISEEDLLTLVAEFDKVKIFELKEEKT